MYAYMQHAGGITVVSFAQEEYQPYKGAKVVEKTITSVASAPVWPGSVIWFSVCDVRLCVAWRAVGVEGGVSYRVMESQFFV